MSPTLFDPASSVGGSGSQGQQETRRVDVVLRWAKDGPLLCGLGLVNVGAVLIRQGGLRCLAVQLRVWSWIYWRVEITST